jgi:excisionase family DNA binding protein
MPFPMSVRHHVARPGAGTGAADRKGVLPVLLTVTETAELLRTTRRAIYLMVERRQLPGVTRIGRRVLFRADELLDWLDQKRAPSPKE